MGPAEVVLVLVVVALLAIGLGALWLFGRRR